MEFYVWFNFSLRVKLLNFKWIYNIFMEMGFLSTCTDGVWIGNDTLIHHEGAKNQYDRSKLG